jgi:transposase
MMREKRRRSQRQRIDLEQLKNDPDSFLSWGIDDPTLGKLETYRLYQAGYAVADIAEAFGLSAGYLYEMWGKFKAEGTVALVDKRWGAAPRKRTTDREAEVLRAKALHPERGDSDLAVEFGLERSTVYRLLKEHGLQDLHRVLAGSSGNEPEQTPPAAKADDGEKRGSKSFPVRKRCC